MCNRDIDLAIANGTLNDYIEEIDTMITHSCIYCDATDLTDGWVICPDCRAIDPTERTVTMTYVPFGDDIITDLAAFDAQLRNSCSIDDYFTTKEHSMNAHICITCNINPCPPLTLECRPCRNGYMEDWTTPMDTHTAQSILSHYDQEAYTPTYLVIELLPDTLGVVEAPAAISEALFATEDRALAYWWIDNHHLNNRIDFQFAIAMDQLDADHNWAAGMIDRRYPEFW